MRERPLANSAGRSRRGERFGVNAGCIRAVFFCCGKNMDRLSGRTAIVTGGAKGIGRHYCRALKRDEQPEDLLGALAFLASGGSDFNSGQTIAVDGGSINT
jgi:hypothetical protein